MPKYRNPYSNKLLRIIVTRFHLNVDKIEPETTFEALGITGKLKDEAMDLIGEGFLIPIPQSKRAAILTVWDALCYVEKNPQVLDGNHRRYLLTQ